MRERYGTRGPAACGSLCLVIREDGETVGRCGLGRSCSEIRPSCCLARLPSGRSSRARARPGPDRRRCAGPGSATGRWSCVWRGRLYPKFGFVPAAPYDLDWPGFIEPSGCNSSSAGRAARRPSCRASGSTLDLCSGITAPIYARSASSPSLWRFTDRTASSAERNSPICQDGNAVGPS